MMWMRNSSSNSNHSISKPQVGHWNKKTKRNIWINSMWEELMMFSTRTPFLPSALSMLYTVGVVVVVVAVIGFFFVICTHFPLFHFRFVVVVASQFSNSSLARSSHRVVCVCHIRAARVCECAHLAFFCQVLIFYCQHMSRQCSTELLYLLLLPSIRVSCSSLAFIGWQQQFYDCSHIHWSLFSINDIAKQQYFAIPPLSPCAELNSNLSMSFIC